MEKEVSYDELQHAYDVLQELNKFRESKEQCDFIIKVGSKEILVHRNVLCANSDYFKAMLAHDTRENQTGCVELKDMDEECVLKCADFMYGKKISISDDKWQQMVHSADRLQIRRLIKHLVKFFQSHLEVQNVYTFWNLALTYHFSDLEQKCEEFAAKNFNAVSQFDEFNELPLKNLEILIESPMNEASETSKLMALFKWIQHDSSSRKEFLPSMLRKLDLSQIPVPYKRHLVENQPLIETSIDAVKLLCISIMDSLDVPRLDPAGFEAVAENKSLVLFDDSTRHLQYFDLEKKSISAMHQLNDNMVQGKFSAVALLDFIYILFENKSVYRLKINDKSATWVQVADTIKCHGQIPPAVVDARNIYVAGSWWGSDPKSVEMYDPLVDNWIMLCEREVNEDAAILYLQRCIYCIGGQKDDTCSSDVKMHDLDSKLWHNLQPLLTPRNYAAAVAHFRNIYVIGGKTKNQAVNDIEMYEPEKNSWTALSPMLYMRNAFNAFLIGNDIYSVGGYNKYPSTIEKYSISNDEWTKVDFPENMNLKILWSVGLKK